MEEQTIELRKNLTNEEERCRHINKKLLKLEIQFANVEEELIAEKKVSS